ncbi:hypothetical protein [Streptomyces sp. LS1784]|uniref:hypothetical protein n=1 Tax=Streptomyces sp. LS1784 TaxID=2851533 RepID=UPI001CCE7389|nr:hypothetical protein [Streptomyces sp. LS1784]
MHLATLARHTLSRGATPAATYALIARLGHRPLPVARGPRGRDDHHPAYGRPANVEPHSASCTSARG